jgi:Tol biopolymer transport system component
LCELILARVILFCLLVALTSAASAHSTKPTLTEPAVSPDGGTIAFVSGGDIWSVAAEGGDAHVLVSGMGNASRPLYSPDGARLAFVSDKTGGGDIYLLTLDTGRLRRVTFADGREALSGWSHDGRWLYFSASRDNIAGMKAVYRVRAKGGTPMPVSLELHRNEEEGVPSPDGKSIALVGGGWGSAQWWRDGHAHIDDGAIWLLDNDGRHHYTRITPNDARALWPMWSATGKSVYYMSDRSGTENLWRAPRSQVHGKPAGQKRITDFDHGRVL